MGVPGFFLWLMKKYKTKKFIFQKELLDDITIISELNNIDYFLIDTNCLIHPVCFKIIKDNPNLTDNDILENIMLNSITEYLDKLINYVNPIKGIYIAIDGVAPIAKIKQQRQRRFKSVADKILWNNIKKKHSKPIYSSWSNSAITPGTKFMEKLHKHILNWYTTIDKHIIYSSYLTPGEGEHKLLQFIRNNQNMNNNYSYLIYGLDADLIFLALSTNSDKIYLLREGNEINNNIPVDILNYVSIKIMKELIVKTINTYYFNKYSNVLCIELLADKIICDFIFICYFLGNDFIPHIPSLDIHQNGIEYLLLNYIDTFHEMIIYNNYNQLYSSGFFECNNQNKIDINNLTVSYLIDSSSKINNIFFETFLKKLSTQEEYYSKNNLKNNYNKKYYGNINDEYEKELFRIENLQFKINDPIKLGYDSFDEWRKRYYQHYWNVDENELEEFSQKLVKHYLYGLKWIALYYFDKCPSWDWYYPFDYPPFITDIYKYLNNTKLNNIKFRLSKPIKPYLQLLLVLPLQSSYLLPFIFMKHISDPQSIISSLYPINFNQDFINKKKHWMAIPMLPQLNINLTKQFYMLYKNELSKEEQLQNKCNKIFVKA